MTVRLTGTALLLTIAGCGGPPAPPPAAPPAAPSTTVPASPPPTPPASTSASAVVPPAPSASAAKPEGPRPPEGSPAARCREGDLRSCDELAEFWAARELPPETLLARGKMDGEALREACDGRQIASACMGYALMLKYGSATGKRDNLASKPYFAKLKSLGDLNGLRGEPRTADGERVLKETQAACEAGRARACEQLGWAAYNGVQREKSNADAYAGYLKGCDLGSGTACRWAGHFATEYPEIKATAKAEGHLRKGCDELHAPGACDELGVVLQKAKKKDAALALFTKACEEGSRSACGHQGAALVAKKQVDKGKALLKTACDAGEDDACKELSGGGAGHLAAWGRARTKEAA